MHFLLQILLYLFVAYTVFVARILLGVDRWLSKATKSNYLSFHMSCVCWAGFNLTRLLMPLYVFILVCFFVKFCVRVCVPPLRIMGSQNWYFGDPIPNPVKNRVKPVFFGGYFMILRACFCCLYKCLSQPKLETTRISLPNIGISQPGGPLLGRWFHDSIGGNEQKGPGGFTLSGVFVNKSCWWNQEIRDQLTSWGEGGTWNPIIYISFTGF